MKRCNGCLSTKIIQPFGTWHSLSPEPAFRLDLSRLLALAPFAGTAQQYLFNGPAMTLVAALSSIHSPVYLEVNVADASIVDEFLATLVGQSGDSHPLMPLSSQGFSRLILANEMGLLPFAGNWSGKNQILCLGHWHKPLWRQSIEHIGRHLDPAA